MFRFPTSTLQVRPHAYAYIINLLMTKGKFAGENHVVEVWKTKHKLKRPIGYFPIAHNTLCLPPKFCITYCLKMLLGKCNTPRSI